MRIVEILASEVGGMVEVTMGAERKAASVFLPLRGSLPFLPMSSTSADEAGEGNKAVRAAHPWLLPNVCEDGLEVTRVGCLDVDQYIVFACYRPGAHDLGELSKPEQNVPHGSAILKLNSDERLDVIPEDAGIRDNGEVADDTPALKPIHAALYRTGGKVQLRSKLHI
ncbi:hypothetical protein QFZ82_007819 [Streptomyces sp. V4I23]|nr:hypothetical protein [Streptomyces sp. V4I23]